MTRLILGLTFLVGCGGDAKPAPSCFDAFTHFYATGCTLVDLSSGQPVPQGTVIAQCQSSAASLPAGCKDELDAYLTCTDTVTPAMKCDCTTEQMVLIGCK